ncbi:hypothetical protein [Herbaspirillum autotrophicum]|uniref:hypothetical protein n=1 Tax=Herbaspirillum autotrophicum TaxID=180195 RepID=UPI00067DBA74|nr:hypothetical protein [Herbaspirillum autotrophicum]
MNHLRVMRILLVLIGIVGIVKGIFFFTHREYDQLLFLVCISLWLVWIINAVFKNWNLPAPFAFNEGTNQLGRMAYFIVVAGLFLYVAYSQ